MRYFLGLFLFFFLVALCAGAFVLWDGRYFHKMDVSDGHWTGWEKTYDHVSVGFTKDEINKELGK